MNDYFDKIICINRSSRTDRWDKFQKMCERYGLEVARFNAHEGTQLDGSFNGNYGCTSSHRGVLELICHNGWNRTLIFEDDSEAVEPGRYGDHAANRLPLMQQWEQIKSYIPEKWDMLYLGGHYGSRPQARLSQHIIKIDTMLTTSSYAVSLEFAKKIVTHIYGIGPIDSLMSGWQPTHQCYCVQPRLFVQYENESDLQHKVMDNAPCMLDPNHEAMV